MNEIKGIGVRQNNTGQRRATIGEVVRSLAFYVLFYGATLVLGLGNLVLVHMGQARVVRQCELWSGFHRWCVEHVLGIAVTIEGTVPTGAVLVAMKHESFFEAIDAPTLLDHPGIFAKVELLRLPLWGRAGLVYGLVPVERDQGAKALRAMFGAAKALAAEGRPLLIFPEGTRVPHGQRPALQAGFAGLYKILGLSVVPVAVDSGPFYHHFIKRRGGIIIRFGEVIPAGLPREEIEARVHVAINAKNRAVG